MSTLKIVIAIIGLMVLLSIAGVVAKIVFFPAHALKTGIDSAYDITDKTLSGDNVIYNYEWFKRQYEDIKATENKRDIAKKQVLTFKEDAGARENWTFEDKNEYSRLSAVHQGLENHLQDLIAEYNARSQMATRSIFKEGLIPETMEFVTDVIK